jgi:hypothetical protein
LETSCSNGRSKRYGNRSKRQREIVLFTFSSKMS